MGASLTGRSALRGVRGGHPCRRGGFGGSWGILGGNGAIRGPGSPALFGLRVQHDPLSFGEVSEVGDPDPPPFGRGVVLELRDDLLWDATNFRLDVGERIDLEGWASLRLSRRGDI